MIAMSPTNYNQSAYGYGGMSHGSPLYTPPMQSSTSPSNQTYRGDVACSIYIERPPSLDSESQMRIYEELDREASLRKEKLNMQLETLMGFTA